MSSKLKRVRTNRRDYWQKQIDSWRARGLSVSKFCRQHRLSESTFYSWRKRFTDEITVDGAGVVPESFIEVSLDKQSVPILELSLQSGNILRIGSGVDAKTLTEVISILQQAGLC